MKKKTSNQTGSTPYQQDFNKSASQLSDIEDTDHEELKAVFSILDYITPMDLEDLEFDAILTIAAFRSVGSVKQGVIALESTRILECALDKVRNNCFPDGDLSEMKIQMNGHLFTAQLRELMIGYASGETPIPPPAFNDIHVDIGINRLLN